MGKQKHRRGRLHKKNPTGLMSVKDFNEVEDTTEGNKESALQSVYDDVSLSIFLYFIILIYFLNF